MHGIWWVINVWIATGSASSLMDWWGVCYGPDVTVVVFFIIPKLMHDNTSCKLHTTETFKQLSLYSAPVYVATSTAHHNIMPHIIECQ